MKKCSKCQRELPLGLFYKNTRAAGRPVYGDGLQGICKSCVKLRRQSRGDWVNVTNRKRRSYNVQVMNQTYWNNKCKEHKLDGKEVRGIFESQNRKCFYCDIELNGKNSHIEHYYPKKNDKIVIACVDCNHLKWMRNGDEFIEFLKEYISRFS